MSLIPGTRIGPYEVTGPLGEGRMGQVYRARDTTLDRDVAIKILPEAFAHDADRLAAATIHATRARGADDVAAAVVCAAAVSNAPSKGVGDLLRNGQRLVDRERAAGNAPREIVALDQFHHERGDAVALFEPVDAGDVRMVQRGQNLGFAREPRQGVSRKYRRAGKASAAMPTTAGWSRITKRYGVTR